MSERDRNKLYFIFISFCLLFLIIIARAFFIQVVNKKKLLAYSKDQLLRKAVIFPNRGNIYDRNGHPLAINIQTYNIFSMPKDIRNRQQTLAKLAVIVPKFTVKKLNKILKERTRFTWIARQIKLDQEQIIKIKKLKGIFLEKTAKRIYPNHELMAQVLGFVGIDNAGLGGIEYQFNDLLKGDAKIIKYLKDAKGRPLKFESYDTENKAGNVYLTLDKDIQAISEKYLKEAVKKYNALRGGVGVMDVTNGEVLAIANYPSFDPNELKKRDQAHRRPSFVTDPFEPGSVFKIFTVISALENKIVTTETNYFCEYGRLKVDNHVITESDTSKKHEWLSVANIIKYSSNIGTVKIAFDLTFPLLDKTIKKFGFGEKTNIELPGESRGIYNDNEKISQLSLSNLSFGQGVATTGIQMLTAYAIIANNGIYHPPTIIERPKKNRNRREGGGQRIISSNMAMKLQQMLISVVEEGTAKDVKIPYFNIAGKTGTAQKTDNNGEYTGYIPNFIGFPVGVKKKFVAYAYVENPKGKVYSGGKVAAPIVKKIMEYMFFKNKEYQGLAAHPGEVERVMATVDRIDQTTLVEGPMVQASAIAKDGKREMPSFIGLDKKSSSILAKKIGVHLQHQGMGVVAKQSIRAGASLLKDVVVILEHRPPRYE